MTTNHDLKCWPPYWADIARAAKRVEIRKDDRGYRVGDRLTLREWDPSSGAYTGRTCERWVMHVLPGGQFGLADGYVALSLGGGL
jgi:hypothetical protein